MSADSTGELLARVLDGVEAVEHTVNLGGYEYSVYMNRNVAPPAVVVKLTRDSRHRIFDLADGQFRQTLADLKKLEKAYIRQLRGEPQA